ncbi:DUF397 domain-containing protein [Nocardia sp. CY41]|uniref:DUF397 domain-containing protein n=1 Tax=Nocardia sp. CY41 TaxID=2608686 RepID=UPI00135937C7
MNASLSDVTWFKSSYSSAEKDCVEVAFLGEGCVGVRDSKNPTGPALVFTPREWDSFTARIASNERTRLTPAPRGRSATSSDLPLGRSEVLD